MKAIAVKRGEQRPRVIEKSQPEPDADEALVRVLRVGIDGTDHEVISGGHGGFPEDADHMVLGHEAVGVIEEPAGDFEAGDVVTPTVRRPPDGTNEYFERGEPDMAPDGYYHECGIYGAHGYMAEYITVPPEFLVAVPREYAEYGFLIEPISNTEKALNLAYGSREPFRWEPESALVLGNGPLGLVSLAMLDDYDRRYCLGRRDRPDPTIDIIEELGATYVDSRKTPIPEIPEEHEPIDLIIEATGYAPHAFETIEALAPNGVGALLGIPGNWEFEIDGGKLHHDLVMENKALLGSVNSHIPHFEDARETLLDLPEWLLEDLITGVFAPEESQLDAAFDDGNETIKSVIEFDTL